MQALFLSRFKLLMLLHIPWICVEYVCLLAVGTQLRTAHVSNTNRYRYRYDKALGALNWCVLWLHYLLISVAFIPSLTSFSIYGSTALADLKLLDRMIAFISTSVTSSLNHTHCSGTGDIHSLQFTVTHALDFSAFNSRILATDLNIETVS
jgi:hypothetical protein